MTSTRDESMGGMVSLSGWNVKYVDSLFFNLFSTSMLLIPGKPRDKYKLLLLLLFFF
jgi:hypothetical protein